MYQQILSTNITRNLWRSVRRIQKLNNTHFTEFILEVDYLCISILKNTSDVKLGLALHSATFGGVDLGSTEKRPEAGIQVAARKTGATENTASS